MTKLVGKIERIDAEVVMVFRVGKKRYPATGHNAELFETYIHTGDAAYLNGLTNEMVAV